MPMNLRETGNVRPGVAAMALGAVLAALLATAPGQAARKAGATVTGTVKTIAGEPIAGIEVTLEAADGTRAGATTDKRGKFSISVTAGDYLMSFAGEGWARLENRLTVEAGSRPVVSVELLDAAAGRRSEAAKAFNAGVAARQAGDRATARASFLAAVEIDPTLVEAHGVLAEIYLDEGAAAAAARSAESYLEVRPDDRQVRLIAYEAYRELGNAARTRQARRVLAADPELAPKLAVHAFNEGVAADRNGDAEAARAGFQEAVELDGRLAAAHLALAALEFQADRHDLAAASLRAGLDLEPASAHGRRLAFLLADATGEPEAAAEAMAAYAEVDPAGAAEILFRRAEVDFKNDDRAAARDALVRVIELEPDRAEAHHLLGLAYLTGDAELAKRHLRRFLELAPQHPEAAAVEEILDSLE